MDALTYNKRRGYTDDQTRAIQSAIGAKPDGVWGPKTIAAVKRWQKDHGLKADGMVGPRTYAAILADPSNDAAEPDPIPTIRHPLPKVADPYGWGYDHAPPVWHESDPQWAQITGTGSFLAGLLRLVSGHRKSHGREVFSRGPDSWISLDEFSISFAHWWANTAPELLAEICEDAPRVAAWAWGEAVAEAMRSEDWIRSKIRVKRGKRAHQSRYDWLLSGWYEIARHPAVIAVCVDHWVEMTVPDALREFDRRGWSRAQSLAALVRVVNSRGGGGMRSLLRKAERLSDSDSEEAVIETLYHRADLYNKPRRLKRIKSMAEFRGGAPGLSKLPGVSSLDMSAPVVRVDGSSPEWVKRGAL